MMVLPHNPTLICSWYVHLTFEPFLPPPFVARLNYLCLCISAVPLNHCVPRPSLGARRLKVLFINDGALYLGIVCRKTS